jgi:hypothetical protein
VLSGKQVTFAAVDCTVERSICSVYNVGGFPTFKYFSYFNKEQKDYDGGRTTKVIHREQCCGSGSGRIRNF